MDKINVKDLFLLDPKNGELPDFLLKKNVVYVCKNLINGKQYVGETRSTLYDRWCGWGKLSHKGLYEYRDEPNRVLYNALRKYGPENFEVSILEEGLEDTEKRKSAESRWIETLHTYVGDESPAGYNMNKGGGNCEQILSKEAREKAKNTNREHHNGKLAFQSNASREKAKETQFKKYGGYAMHLQENREKGFETQRNKYGGKLAFNLPESIEKAQKSAPLHRMIGCIIRHIQILKDKSLQVNARNYVFETNDQKHMWQQHIPHVLNKLDELRKIYKWTQEMEDIFSNISYDNTKKGIQKILFNDEN